MNNNNKILTVSYGTFSCTLEGFDDSFGTMKAIAEYFRDLAADDRYFGAEPPQPDAEMLARIAQREVSRRVEAREQDGKIVLSALEDGTKSEAATPVAESVALSALAAAPDMVNTVVENEKAEAEVADFEDDIEIATTPVDALEADAETIALETDVEEDAEVSTGSDSVDVQTQEHETDTVVETAEEEAPEPVAEAETEKKQDAKADLIEEPDEAVFVEDENDIVPGQPDAEVEAFFADSPSVTEIEEDPQVASVPAVPVDAAPEAPAPDSIAAKLQRIRAVVAQHEEADEEDDYLEDEHAEAGIKAQLTADADDLIADARADIEDALEADEAADAQAYDEESFADDADADDVNAILSRLESETENAPAPRAAELDEVAEDNAAEDAEDRSIEDSISNLFDENEETLADEAPVVAAPKVSLRKTPRVEVAQEPVAEEADEDETAQAPAPRARVIKVKRADLEAAIQKGDLEEYDDDDADMVEEAQSKPRELDDLAPARSKETALSPEDEAELARELAELEDDISATDPVDAAPKVRVRRPGTETRNTLPSIDDGNESDVNRLLAETDHQMDEPESATRRDAFAHLRAAVAAKQADVDAGVEAVEQESDEEYRSDLAEVVRPRRPVSASSRTERPSDARPAPLKLVAEQRIDVAKSRAEGPVRPRRISAHEDTAPEAPEGESFADFAADMGASTLPQLLEAAAAYMSFVEGREQFSRPQLMSKVRQAGGDEDFTREESLRSFGQLLRTGKIEKLKAGRFTVSEDIGYRPDQRAAG